MITVFLNKTIPNGGYSGVNPTKKIPKFVRNPHFIKFSKQLKKYLDLLFEIYNFLMIFRVSRHSREPVGGVPGMSVMGGGLRNPKFAGSPAGRQIRTPPLAW
jgi:hypothetical protein